MANERPKQVPLPQTRKGQNLPVFRYRGRLTPLPADENSTEFRRAYDAAMRAIRLATAAAPPAMGSLKTGARYLPDTLGAAIDRYLDSAAYDRLAPSAKRNMGAP